MGPGLDQRHADSWTMFHLDGSLKSGTVAFNFLSPERVGNQSCRVALQCTLRGGKTRCSSFVCFIFLLTDVHTVHLITDL